jgi:hypothetical protein
MNLMYDDTWLKESKEMFLGNADLVRLVGNDHILGLLKSDNMKLEKLENADPYKMLDGMFDNISL